MVLGMGPIELLLALVLLGGLPASLFYLGLRFVRAQERRSIDTAEIEAIAARVGAMEERLEAMSSSLEQIAEGQRFTTAVLAEPARELPRS